MVKYILALAILFVGDSSIKYRLLKDGITKVPSDPEFFTKKYRDRYTIDLPKNIDTKAVYIRSYSVDSEGKLYRMGIERKGELVGAYKFYTNGCVNNFIIENTELENLPELDPETMGYRGIIYNKKNRTYIDYVAPANELRKLGIISYEIKVSGDTLFLNDYNNRGGYIYLKQKISSEQNKYTADW